MEIILSKYAGFCYGVSRALDTVKREAADKRLCTLGAIINNKQVTAALAAKGVRIIENPADAAAGETVVIRSHGVPPRVYDTLNENGTPFIDCTCRDVKNIHDIAAKSAAAGRCVIIAGDENHAEVIGIRGYAGGAIVVASPRAALLTDFDTGAKYALVAQTTYLQEDFDEVVKCLAGKGLDLEIHNTICGAMINRRREASELSQKTDAMIVIGDKTSSNSTKLYEICKQNCKKTIFIETLEDLQLNIFSANGKIGIVAGASTPPEIIKEAYLTMSELENNLNEQTGGQTPEDTGEPEVCNQTSEDTAEPESVNQTPNDTVEDTVEPVSGNQTFQEMLDESFITLHTGDVVKGTVIQVAGGEVSVNLGYKSDGLIPKNEYSDDPSIDPADEVKPGDPIEVFVVRVNDGDGNVLLSKKKIDSKRNYTEVETAFTEKTPIKGKVIEVVKGGVIAIVKGVRVFVPSSQVSNRYVEDLAQFKGKEMNFEIIEFDRAKRRIVGSRKALAAKEQDELKEKVFSSIEVGQAIEGVVNRVVTFGAFVDLGGVDGLIHISELSWGRVKKVSDVLKEGDKVMVRVLEMDKDKGRISLSLKDTVEDPWSTVEEKYHIGEVIEGKVVRMAPFGAFIELEEGVDGLIHVSQIAHHHVARPEDALSIGEIVSVKVMDVNRENNRISLSKKEAEPYVYEEYDDDYAPAENEQEQGEYESDTEYDEE